jgi:hypothetical protein
VSEKCPGIRTLSRGGGKMKKLIVRVALALGWVLAVAAPVLAEMPKRY